MPDDKTDSPETKPSARRVAGLPTYGPAMLAAVAFILPLVGLFIPRGTVILLTLCALPALHDRAARMAALQSLRGPAGLLVAALLIWGGASALWSPVPAETSLSAGKVGALLAGMFLAAVMAQRLDEEGLEMLRTALLAGFLAGLALLAVEVIFDSPIRRLVQEAPGKLDRPLPWWLNRGISVALLLVWPAALLCWRRFGRWSAALPILALAVIIAFGPQSSAFVALPLALAAALVVLLAGRRALPPLAALLAATLLAAPLLVKALPQAETVRADYQGVPTSFIHRLHVWQFANDRLAERPLHGWGIRASRVIPGGEVLIELGGNRPGKTMPLHPHNGLLQIWLELGAIGALLAAAFIFLAVSSIRHLKTDRAGQAALMGTITTGFVFSSLSYGIWQTWWLAAIGLSVIFTLTQARDFDVR